MPEIKPPTFVHELIIGTIAAAIVGLLYVIIERATEKSWIAILCALIAGTLIILVVIFVFARRTASEYKSKLQLVGVEDVLENYHKCPPMADLIADAVSSVEFFGISGRTFFEVVGIEELVKRRTREGIVFRFLLLDPASPYLAPGAEAEQSSPEAWRADIIGSIERLKAIQRDVNPVRVTVRTYNAPPTWRAFFLDKRIAYVNYYAPEHGGRGTPLMVIENHQNSLFHPLYRHFDQCWNDGKQV